MFSPKFSITSKMVNHMSEIAEIKAMVERSPLLPAREAFLRRAAVIKMAHTSTSIEGNRLQEYQVKKVAEGEKVVAPADQVREVENYLVALRRIDSIYDKKHEFDEKDILEIHKTVITGLVEPEKIGVWRRGPVYIVNLLPDGKEELAYSPPASSEVLELIGDLLNWLKKARDEHPIIRAGLFHYQFETIHPFTDGNGRVGRLLTLLHLYQSGWDFRKALVLEDYYNRDRKRYYEHLQTGDTYKARQSVDLTSWLEYFVEGFLDEVVRVKEQILAIETVGEKGVSGQILNEDELKIIDFVVSMGRITSEDVVDILLVPKRTAQAKLKRLEDMKALKKRGAGPATYYSV